MNSLLHNLRSRAARRRLAGAVIASCAAVLLWCSSAEPITGRWTTSWDYTGGIPDKYAVHLAVLPGDGKPYLARVLWWRGEGSNVMWGGQWGWKPGYDVCAGFPTASFTELGLPPSGVNIFCSGHVPMNDPQGRLLVIGGADSVTDTFGEIRVRIFTPGSGTAPGTWSRPERMKNWRWYPGSVALRDGRLVAMSGDQHRRHSIFGGRTSSGVEASPQGDSLYRFAPVDGGAWEPALIPDREYMGAPLPEPRESHTAVVAPKPPFVGQVYFGGRRANGVPLNDFWILRRDVNTLARIIREG